MARPRPAVDLEALFTRVDELVRAHGAVPRRELTPLRRHLPELAARLRARGYEVGATVRRPLEEQLIELVEEGFVPSKRLEKRVAGGSAREVKEAVGRLVARGELAVVIRESGGGFVRATGGVVPAGDLDELLRCLTKVQRLVRRARANKGSGASVLREDVALVLSRWASAIPARDDARAPSEATLSDALSREIGRRLRQDHRPIRVPDLLRAVGVPAEEGRRALLEGASRGLFELEPESGMGRLSLEDAEMCPVGPMGTRLSWVVARAKKGQALDAG